MRSIKWGSVWPEDTNSQKQRLKFNKNDFNTYFDYVLWDYQLVLKTKATQMVQWFALLPHDWRIPCSSSVIRCHLVEFAGWSSVVICRAWNYGDPKLPSNDGMMFRVMTAPPSSGLASLLPVIAQQKNKTKQPIQISSLPPF